MPKASTSCAAAASDKLPEDERFDLNVADIAEVWRRGSVVASWLLDLTAIALAKSPDAGGVQRQGGRQRRRPLDRRRPRWTRRWPRR